jgi:hypothetical protein
MEKELQNGTRAAMTFRNASLNNGNYFSFKYSPTRCGMLVDISQAPFLASIPAP